MGYKKDVKKIVKSVLDELKLPYVAVYVTEKGSYYAPRIPLISEERIVIQNNVSNRDLLHNIYHEVGHYFFEYHRKEIFRRGYKEMFGYAGVFAYYMSYGVLGLCMWFKETENAEEIIPHHPEFVTPYAQTHNYEDWAESFAFAYRDLVEGKKKVAYGNKVLNDKIRFVKKCIKEIP